MVKLAKEAVGAEAAMLHVATGGIMKQIGGALMDISEPNRGGCQLGLGLELGLGLVSEQNRFGCLPQT